MRIKDAMRESCIRLVVDSVQQLVVTHQTAAAEVAGRLLQALARYVAWSGIELVANERMLPLLMSALQCPAPSIRVGATSCLTGARRRLPCLWKGSRGALSQQTYRLY